MVKGGKVSMLQVGDKVRVKDNIEIVHEDEKLLIDKEAVVTIYDDYVFPIEVKFVENETQQMYEWLSIRRFDEHELVKIG